MCGEAGGPDGFRRGDREVRSRTRSRGARRVLHRRPRCSAAARRRSAASPTPTSARCAWRCPGAMPVVNRTAVESAIKIGLALNCQIAEWCRFARKNYFYPDMPKNFQTSQYDEPIAFDGWLDVEVEGYRRAGAHRDRARAHGGGHREVAARRRFRGSHPRRGVLAARLQPGRRAAGRDRHPAHHGHPRERARGGPRLRRGAAGPVAGAGRLRRPDGPGLAALRRQPVAGPGRRGRAGHPHRDQERQLAAFGRPGGPARDLPPGGHSRRRRAGSSRRRGTSRRPAGPPGPGRSKETAEDYRYFPEPDLVPIAPARRVGRGAARRAAGDAVAAPGDPAEDVGLHRSRDA